MVNIRHLKPVVRELMVKSSGRCNKLLYNYIYNAICAPVLVACLVTPALWLNLSDYRNTFIIHFGLLLKERTLDSIGHDLWKKYNVICLLWMIRYISLLTNIFTRWILIDA